MDIQTGTIIEIEVFHVKYGVVYKLKLTDKVPQKQQSKLNKYHQVEELEQRILLQLQDNTLITLKTLQKLMTSVQKII